MIVVDASVAAKWVVVEPYADQALALVAAVDDAEEVIAAPSLLPFEIANILRKRMIRQDLGLTDADRLMALFLTFPVELWAPGELSRRALAIAEVFQLPAVYDAHYVALAERLVCPLWTDDRRLLGLVGGKLPFVRWIGDYQPGGWPAP